jgi:hypothetical protein
VGFSPPVGLGWAEAHPANKDEEHARFAFRSLSPARAQAQQKRVFQAKFSNIVMRLECGWSDIRARRVQPAQCTRPVASRPFVISSVESR